MQRDNIKQQVIENELSLYQYVMGRVTDKNIGKDGRASLPNPFKFKDKKYSFSIYPKQNRLYFREHGDGGYGGDIFDFMGRFLNLDTKSNFKLICIKALQILNIYRENYTNPNKVHIHNSNPKKLNVKVKEFTESEYQYWERSGITADILNQFNVKSINSYETKNGKIIRYSNSKSIFAYDLGNNCYKIYQPSNPKYKWLWIGEKPKSYVFGLDQLPEAGSLLLIAAGERDTLSLVAHGYNAICLNSETAKIPETIIESLKQRFDNIALIYDTDNTGEKCSSEIESEFQIDRINLRDILPLDLGKDVSDYYCAVLNKKLVSQSNIDKLIKDYLASKTSESIELDEIPDEVYDNLPPLLKRCVEDVILPHERDIIFFSCLTAMGAPLHNYKMYYDNKYNYANLFFLIIAPPASGKGNTYHSRNMLEPVHEYYKTLQKQNVEQNLNDEQQKYPQKDVVPGIHYPDRSTEPAVAQLMSKSLGATGVLYANELDSLSNSRKSEHGDLSVIIRESFQNETYLKYLKTENDNIEIASCKLSCIFTGTYDQLKRYISSVENGVASRFINLFPNSTTEFKNVLKRPDEGTPDWKEKYRKIGEELLNIIKEMNMEEKEYFFIATESQANIFQKHFQKMLDYAYTLQHTEAISSVFRVAIISAKIMMIYAVLLKSRNDDTYQLPDQYFNDILVLSKFIFNQSLVLLEHMKSTDILTEKTPQIKKLYNILPKKFTTQNALFLGKSLGIRDRTIRRYIQDKELFYKVAHGEYEKKDIIEKPDFRSVLSA